MAWSEWGSGRSVVPVSVAARSEARQELRPGAEQRPGAIVSWHRAPGPGAVVKSESRPIGATTAPRLPPEIAAAESGDKKRFLYKWGPDDARHRGGRSPDRSGARARLSAAQHHSREQWRAEDSAAYRRVGCQHDIHNTADRTTTDKGRAAQLVLIGR